MKNYFYYKVAVL